MTKLKGDKMDRVVLTTTFELLKNHSACEEGYRKLGKYLGGITTYGKRTPINLLTILESNGVDDMLWCLRATKENCDKVSRLMAADFAEEVLPIFEKAYPDDKRPRKAIQASRDFANGRISSEEREATGEAARIAAWGAAWAAALDAALDAARVAARVAAWAAARVAAGAAARGAVRDATREKQAQICKRYLK